MREGRLRQTVTETDEDMGRETENTQPCQAAAAADIDTGRCQRDEVRWKEIGGGGGSRETQNKHLRREEGRDPTPAGSTGRSSNSMVAGTGRDLDSNNTGPAGSRTREQRLEEKTVMGVHPETHFRAGGGGVPRRMQEAQQRHEDFENM